MKSIHQEPCTECGKKDWLGQQYRYDSPNHFDGVSEWRCQNCNARFGRWTHKLLGVGETERPYGGEQW